MPPMHLPILYLGTQGEKTLNTFFDETISLSRINSTALNGIESPKRLGRPRTIHDPAKGNSLLAQYGVCLDFYINGILLSDEFIVMPQQIEEVIMGGATIRKWRMRMDVATKTIFVDPRMAKHQLI